MSRIVSRRSTALMAIIAVHVLLAVAYGIATPVFEANDELYHFGFVKHLADARELPVQTLELGRSESHQAPLYYALGSLITFWTDASDFPSYQRFNPWWGWHFDVVGADNRNQFLHTSREAFPYQGTALALHVLRLLSPVFGAVTVWLTYLIGMIVFRGRGPLALATASLVALNPQFVFVNSYANNDAAVAALSTAVIYLCLKLQRDGDLRISRFALLGVLIGCAGLTKISAIVSLPLVALTLFSIARRRGRFARALACATTTVALTAILVGWWIARNLSLYGEWSGMDTMYTIWNTRRSVPLDPGDILALGPRVWNTYWGFFGWGNVPMDRGIYLGLAVIAGVALLGVARNVARRTRPFPRFFGTSGSDGETWQPRLFPVVLLFLWQGLMLVSIVAYMRTALYAEFGRFLFPAISSTAVFLVWGLAELIPSKVRPAFPWITTTGLAALSAFALFAYLIPAYHLPDSALIREDAAAATVSVANFADDAEIISYEVTPVVATPGESIEVTVAWRPLRKMDQDYAVFLHALSAGDNQLVAQMDVFTGGGRYLTSDWVPGRAFRDTYRIALPEALDTPTLLNLEMGLYLLNSSQRVPLLAGTRGTEGNALRLGTIRIPTQNVPTGLGEMARFEQGIVLSGLQMQVIAKNPSDRQLEARLVWRADEYAARRESYTVFVQLLGPAGTVVAQDDSEPANKHYPTRDWQDGDVIADTHMLELPREVGPGTYTILIGLYDVATGRRLAIQSTGGRQTDSAVALDWTLPP